jgi:hypothetical protein
VITDSISSLIPITYAGRTVTHVVSTEVCSKAWMILQHIEDRAETTYAVIMLLMLERERERENNDSSRQRSDRLNQQFSTVAYE